MAAYDKSKQPVQIKKYANRRLYNTASSSYVTLDDLRQMLRDDEDFIVHDAKTGEDITRQVLAQIILDQESKGQSLLPTSFLRDLVRLYGDNMQFMVPSYLDNSMKHLLSNQDKLRDYYTKAISGMFPFPTSIEEMGKTSAKMFENAMQMFAPFAPGAGAPRSGEAHGAAKEEQAAQERLDALNKDLEQLQAEIASLKKKGGE
jgi:polyhydroxyalkanoate synthesis repressor PhaR